MKVVLIASLLCCIVTGDVSAGSEYDKCIKEVNALKAQEASDCSGLSYLFNPSGCFATQKQLKKYTTTEKCKKIGIAENVDFTPPPAVPAKKNSDVSIEVIGKGGDESTATQISCEQLKDENVRLKAENSRLKTENEQLQKMSK